MELLVNVNNQKLRLATNLKSLVAGSQQFIKFTFNLSDEWDDLLTFAQFIQGSNSYNAYLDENNSVYLPHEIEAGTCKLILYGTGSQGEGSQIIATTNYLELNIDENITVANASSTEISQSLYDQLANQFNTIAHLDQSQYGSMIMQQVNQLTSQYLANEEWVGAAIQDGSIARSKVNAVFESTLAKADTAMQPTEYGEGGTKDVFAFADSKAAIVQQDLNTTKTEIAAAYKITNPATGTQITTNNLKESVNKVLELAENYTQSALRDHKSYSTKIVSGLPQVGESNTFYLVPNSAGNGYDKWWYITDESNPDSTVSRWDCFGSATTVVVSSLPQSGANDVDYILKTVNGCLYYKWIDNQWNLVGGSMAEIVNELPQSGSELIDYYVPNSDGVYLHYRWINNGFELIGSDSYSKSEVDSIIQGLSTTIGNRISSVEGDVQTNETNIESLSRTLNRVANDLDNLDVEGYTYSSTLTQNDNGQYIYTLVESKDNVDTIKSQFVLPSGGGSSSTTTTTMVVDRITPSPLIITTTGSAIIEIDFSSLDSDGQTVDGNYTWKLGNSVLMTGTLNQGRNSFDLSNYCAVGTQKFTLIVTDIGGSTNVKTWTIQKVDVRIESNYNDRNTNEIGRNVSFTYTPFGAINKTIHFKLDGVEDTITTSASGTIQSYTVPAQNHGSHLLEVWATATINNVQIETSHIYKDLIWYDPNKDLNNEFLNPVIGCIYRYDYYGNVTARQYDATAIIYNVFDPSTTYPVVKRYVDNELVGTDTLTSSQNIWNFKSSVIGLHTLRIECRNTTVTIKVNITELGIDVNPITGGLEVDFNPTGITNSSDNRLWSNTNYHMSVSNNFDWANGGYQTDENGDTYFLIKAGTRATFDYKMFAGNVNSNPSTNGAEIKIVFKTENVQDANAVWFTNAETRTTEVEGQTVTTNTGILMKVHDGWLKTNNASDVDISVGESEDAENIAATNTYLYMPYSEEDIIEMDINIDVLDTSQDNAKAFVMAYEDGVPSKAYVYDGGDRFFQYDPKDIVIGSDYCDVRIYRLKIYSTALTTSGIMRNFIADSRNSDIMLSRYDRNAIYYNNETNKYTPYSDEGLLDPERLAPIIPNVKILMLDTDHFTTSKKTFVKSTLRCIHAQGGTVYGGDSYYDNWFFENGYHAGQGTTSDNYGNAGRNVDFLFNCDGTHKPSDKVNAEEGYISRVTLGYNTENATTESVTDWKGNAGKVALTRTSVPNNFFNLKVNIASSENVNNALLQKRYNDYLPYISPAKRKDSKVKNDMEFVPAILFLRENNPDVSTHNEFLDDNWHFYALGNIGDSKKTDYTRAYDPTDMNEFTIEISDNTKNNATFQSGVFLDGNNNRQIERFTVTESTDDKGNTIRTPVSVDKPSSFVYPITMQEWNNENNMRHWCLDNEDFDGDHSFEPRYACCGDYRDGKLVNDTTGRGRTQVQLNNGVWRAFYRWVITSTNQEFVNEIEEWVVKSAVEFFYAFTHMYTMMDNRAKNTFWHFAKTGIFRRVSKPVPELLHIYCELINDEYVTTEDTVINNNKTYYTQYAFDLWDYDNDTGLGINNNGELVFPYGKEDTDYNIDNTPSSGYVFNGATSVFWCRLRDLFADEIKTTFNTTVAADCFSATSLINQFDTFQECFPEEIWRLDIQRKYIRTFTGESIDNSKPKHDVQYLRDMMQGRKKYQRRQWIRDQEIYFGTKNLMNTVVGDDNRITFRCFTPTGNDVVVQPDYTLRIKPYSDMYLSVMFGNGGTQQVRAKGGTEYTIECPLSTMDDTQVTIYGANRIQELSDLSACYIAANNFSMATKLRKLVLGNTTTGYSNPRLISLTIGNNKLLEELDIRNCNNLTGSINLSQCSNLLKLYAEGTKITGVTFANNGKIQIAHLPSTVNTLIARNLNNLTDFSANLNYLENLTIEGGTLDSKTIVSNAISTLQILNLYNISWELAETTLLNQIKDMFYSLLTGSVYISGAIRNQEIIDYQNKWSDLTVAYNSANLITQYLATYVNPDGTVLYQTYVDQGATPPDPVTLGYISTPTQMATAQYTFAYNGWDDITSAMLSARTITAQYTQTVRTYTVTWYAREGLSLGSTTANYGAEVVYNGDLPTDTSGETQYIYKVFTGWNKSTGYITEDTDVYAVWETASTLPPTSKDLSQMTCAEIYGVCQAGMASTYFSDKDHFDITLGSDFTFENVQSEVLLENCFFDGNGHRYENGAEKTNSYIDTSIKLFDADSPSFTLALDYEFLGTTVNNGCLVSSCVNNDGEGFKLQYNSNPAIKWGDKTVTVGTSVNRNIVVLRHVKGSNTLFVYTYNKGDITYDSAITRTESVRSSKTETSQVLTFGGIRNANGTEHGFYGKGWIYWAKIWYDDLGDTVARKLSSWIHETLRMEYIGANRYLLPNSMSNYANASFLANNTLPLLRRMNPTVNGENTNAGGWAESEMRTFLNTRLFEALPYKWQAVIKQVSVKSSAGGTSYSITTSNDKLYLAANREVGGSTASPYVDEVDVTSTISFFTNDRKRLKFCGVIIRDDAQYIIESTEPTLLTSYTVNEGDIWVNTNNQNIGYIYMSADTIAKHTRIGYRAISSTDNIQASDGGCWVRASYWWERSPYASSSTSFMYVGTGGGPNNSYSASNTYGVALSFSI